MSPLGVVFPGQGCQYVGMASALRLLSAGARRRLDEADDILGYSLSTLCQDGPVQALDQTVHTQPAIYTATVALWEHVSEAMAWRGPGSDSEMAIVCGAGHSLGEFAALTAAGCMTFEDGLRLVRRRAEAMAEAGAKSPGGMAAILGLSDEAVQELVDDARARQYQLWVANYNSPGQVVVAGSADALAMAHELAEARRAKRVVPLAVSVACHTPLMGGAAEAFGEALADTALRRPAFPIISNVTAQPQSEPEEIRSSLLQQLVSPVRWVESVRAFANLGVDTILEVGPKAVLSGLIRRITTDASLVTVCDAASVANWIASGEALNR